MPVFIVKTFPTVSLINNVLFYTPDFQDTRKLSHFLNRCHLFHTQEKSRLISNIFLSPTTVIIFKEIGQTIYSYKITYTNLSY